MSGRATAFAAVAFLALFMPTVAVVAPPSASLPFAGTTTVTAFGSMVGSFVLQADDVLESYELIAGNRNALLLLHGSNFTRWHIQDEAVAIGNPPANMRAGMYVLYLVTDPAGPVEASLHFRNASGVVQYRLEQAAPASFRPMPLAFAPLRDEGLFLATHTEFQPFEGDAYSGVFFHQEATSNIVQNMQARWSSEDGIHACLGQTWFTIPVLPGERFSLRVAAFNGFAHSAPLRLDWFFRSGTLGTIPVVKSFWVQYAPGDAPDATLPVHRPPTWSIPETRDHDVECLQDLSGRYTSSIDGVLVGAVGPKV